MKFFSTALILASALTLAGCNQQEAEKKSETPQVETAETVATLPDGFFLAAAPEGVVPLAEARANAKTGNTIAFTGYIGGRAKPFTENRAIFLIADLDKAPACTEGCSTPWDACCTPGEAIVANSATVQVVDGDGKVLRLNLDGEKGIKPGARITVVGNVREASESLLVVDATGILVAGE